MNDNNSQEFIAGQSITMQMTLTPEQYKFLQEWAAMVPTLYMLDICAVGATKITDKSLKDQPGKANLITKLRNLDLDNNKFSYLFALMEKVSDSRELLTAEELKIQILADISALRKFFKKAYVIEPDNFLIEFLETLMGLPIESKRTDYLNFLKKLNNHFKLQNPVSPKKRFSKAKEIVLEANSLTISAQHPIVVIALACLYGNKSAKKVMKFKENPNIFDAENALSDISLINSICKY